MALTSASTHQNAIDQINDNLAWEGNPTKAQDLLEAVRWLLFNRAQIQSQGANSLNFQDLQKQEEKLASYVDGVGAGAAKRSGFTKARAVVILGSGTVSRSTFDAGDP